MRATYEKHASKDVLPPIEVTIVAGRDEVALRISDQGLSGFHQPMSVSHLLSLQGGGLLCPDNSVSSPADLFSFSHVRNAARLEDSRLGALRTASRSEHGLQATVDEQIGSWQKAREQEVLDFKDLQIMHPRIGIGLPMSYIFATYDCKLSRFL